MEHKAHRHRDQSAHPRRVPGFAALIADSRVAQPDSKYKLHQKRREAIRPNVWEVNAGWVICRNDVARRQNGSARQISDVIRASCSGGPEKFKVALCAMLKAAATRNG